MPTNPIPAGYHSVTPTFCVEDAPAFIEFLIDVFRASERMRFDSPDGRVMHAEMTIGDSVVMLGSSMENWPARTGSAYVYIEDVDAAYQRALKAGATSVKEPQNQFYGDRSAAVKDKFGNLWGIATHVEDVSPDELQRRTEEFIRKSSAG
jgi:PhnB protein